MTEEQRAHELAWLHVPREDEVSDEVRALWQRADEKLGFVPNVLRAWALRPEHMLRWRRYMDELLKGDSGLSEAQREMIAVVVSSANRCFYCVTAHGGVLRSLSERPAFVDQLATNYRHAELEPHERAMLDFAVKLTEASYRCTEADLGPLRDVGWTDEDIMDIAEVTAMFNLTNRLANAFGWIPNSEYHRMGR